MARTRIVKDFSRVLGVLPKEGCYSTLNYTEGMFYQIDEVTDRHLFVRDDNHDLRSWPLNNVEDDFIVISDQIDVVRFRMQQWLKAQ